jgi:chaperonin cofactor prefoldin
MGRGMGMGGGMMDPGMMPMTGPAPQAASSEQEMEMLKSQAQTLGQQLSEIQHRLEELEKGR